MFGLDPRLVFLAGDERVEPVASHLFEIGRVQLLVGLQRLAVPVKLFALLFSRERRQAEGSLNFGKRIVVLGYKQFWTTVLVVLDFWKPGFVVRLISASSSVSLH